MLDISMATFSFLGLASFIAGVMDAIVGGGGLIVLPSLLVGLPNVALATVLGTSKLTSVFGTATAAANYIGHHQPQYRYAIPMTLTGLTGAALGALVATQISTTQLKPIVLCALIGVWIFTLRRKHFGGENRRALSHKHALALALVGGGLIGFYDGLIGPGTGAFLLFLLVTAEGASFLRASSTSKLVNTGTNVGALLLFAATGHVMVGLGLALALCNVAGSVFGSRLAIRHGSHFVRVVFLTVVAALIVRLSFDIIAA